MEMNPTAANTNRTHNSLVYKKDVKNDAVGL